MISRLIYSFVMNLASGKGLVEPVQSEGAVKREARQKGVRGETFAYWYLRRHGYRPLAKNFTYPGIPGEIDFIGYDGAALAFVEVKLRTGPEPWNPRPEDAVDHAKRRNLIRIARQFLRYRGHSSALPRFDVLAIDSRPGEPPAVRLTKGAFAIPIGASAPSGYPARDTRSFPAGK